MNFSEHVLFHFAILQIVWYETMHVTLMFSREHLEKGEWKEGGKEGRSLGASVSEDQKWKKIKATQYIRQA